MKRSRTSEAILDTMGHRTSLVEFMVKSKFATTYVRNTVLEANALVRRLMQDNTQGTHQELSDRLHRRIFLSRHMLLLESALEEHLANRIGRLRSKMNSWGWASQPTKVRPDRYA